MPENIQHVRERVQAEDGTVVKDQEIDSRDRNQGINRLQSFVQTIVGIIVVLLAIRIVFSLLGANTTNAFASFIYTVTNPLVSPFRGLYGYTFESGIARFEVETLTAMAVYVIAGWIIIRLVALAKRG